MDEEQQPVVNVEAPATEHEAAASVEVAGETTAQVETASDSAVEIERLRQEGETERCAIEAEARVQTEEAYSEARVAEAEANAKQNGASEEWQRNIEAQMTALQETLATLSAQLIPPQSTPAEQSPPTNSPESEEAAPQEAAAAEAPPEPPKRVKKLRWI